MSNEIITNETLHVIHNRHSVRQFTGQDIPDTFLNVILQAANKAPSAHNQQSWRFVVLRGEKKNQLADLITSKAPSFPRPTSALLRMASRSIISAPVVIAVANTGELINRGNELFSIDTEQTRDFFRIMEIQSSAAAVENMLLAATSIGLSSVWLGVLIMIQRDVLRFLEIPDGEFMAVVPVGYSAKQGSSPKKKDLEMFVRYLG
jgi:nitroreductase